MLDALLVKNKCLYTPLIALALDSSVGVALPSTSGILLYSLLYFAISIALYLGVLSCLYVSLCSSSIIIIPKFFKGVNIAERVPTTTDTSPLNIFKYSSYFSPVESAL